MMRHWLALILMAMLLPGVVQADSNLPPAALANTQLPDAKQEAEAKALMETLRCVVCQGQSIADSNAEMAGDMRALVRGKVAAGEKPDAIRAWFIERYGPWVSYKPEMSAIAAPVWIVPLVVFFIGLWLVRGRFRQRSSNARPSDKGEA
nr:cytochrome c-type biogenesis protein [Aquisediminimonas sediminicola]